MVGFIIKVTRGKQVFLSLFPKGGSVRRFRQTYDEEAGFRSLFHKSDLIILENFSNIYPLPSHGRGGFAATGFKLRLLRLRPSASIILFQSAAAHGKSRPEPIGLRAGRLTISKIMG